MARRRLSYLAAIGTTLVIGACGVGDDRPEGGEIDQGLSRGALDGPDFITVEQMRAAVGQDSHLEDAPAQVNYVRLREAFANNRTTALRLPVYELEAVADVQRRIAERTETLARLREATEARGDPTTVLPVLGVPEAARTQQGPWELVLNGASGAELYINVEKAHRGAGGAQREDQFYFARGLKYIGARWDGGETEGLYPYKIRYYKNAVGRLGEKRVISTYEVAVYYNDTIEGLPVIGPGGKISVHMTMEGEVVSHESTLRPRRRVVGVASGAGVLSPDEAQAEVEARLTSRGVDLGRYSLTRREFGYLRDGRSSARNLTAPAYFYMYEPREGTEAKKRAEFVYAIRDPGIAAVLAQDEAVDNAPSSRTPDVRPESE